MIRLKISSKDQIQPAACFSGQATLGLESPDKGSSLGIAKSQCPELQKGRNISTYTDVHGAAGEV